MLKTVSMSRSCFRCGNVKDVVSSNECIAETVFQLSVFVLFCLLESDIHVAIQAGENATVFDRAVKLYHDWSSNYCFQEIGGCVSTTLA